MSDKFVLPRLPTGVPGLDVLLGGGLPELSFNVIAGSPGSGKTTLAHQIMFALATAQRRALFFTVLGEPPLKMLRYQQQYRFFDVGKVNTAIHFINVAEDVMGGDFDRVLARITAEVERIEPSFVFVDSFRSVVNSTASVASKTGDHGASDGGSAALQLFVQRLAMHLTNWHATTFLIGEYMTLESESNPVFTVADGILWLSQSVHRNSMVRKMQVTKMRGHATIAGLHTFRITDDGLQVFPRTILTGSTDSAPRARLAMGVPGLDDLMGGGLPAGYSLLVAGPTGSGKSTLATAFLCEGARAGERGVIAAFEKSPSKIRNPRLDKLISDGAVSVVDTRVLDLSIDETLFALIDMVRRTGATRIVIDSLSGFELALAPTFQEDFRESVHRMVAALTDLGATVLMVSELEDRYTDLRFSPYGAAFLTDAIIVQRYVELAGEIRRVMAVVKIRYSTHSHQLRLFTITAGGIVIGEPLPGMEALLTGHPQHASWRTAAPEPTPD